MLSLLTTFSNHLIALIGGCAATMVAGLAICAIGAAITPRKDWFAPHSAIVGAALFTIVSWYTIKLDIPLKLSIPMTVIFFLTVLLIRAGGVDNARITSWKFPKTQGLLLLEYSLLYAVAYVLMLPSADEDHLPIVYYGNNDIFAYANLSSFLLRLGNSNIYNGDYLSNAYLETPGVFYLLDLVSLFFYKGEVLSALMPVLLGVSATIGLAISHIVKRIFRMPRFMATSLGMLFISGVFYQYIAGRYFLSQIMASAVFLALITQNADLRAHVPGWLYNIQLWIPYYLLVFYIYPPILVIMVLFQVGVDINYPLLEGWGRGQNSVYRVLTLPIKTLAWWMMLMASILIFIAIIDPVHFSDVVTRTAKLSTDNFNGWHLGLISPFAISAIPGQQSVVGDVAQVADSAFFLGLLGLVSISYVKRVRANAGTLQAAYFFVMIFSFVAYFILFAQIGPSYRQWKFASYFPMLLAFLLLPSVFYISDARNFVLHGDPITRASWRDTGLTSIVCVLVIGNLVFNSLYISPSRRDFPSSLFNLRSLDGIGDWSDLFVKMNSFPETFLPVYFIHSKVLHLLSASYYPRAHMGLDSISEKAPLFVEEEHCSGDGGLEVAGVGCMYMRQPSLKPEHPYPFSDDHSFIVGNMYPVESWGRWGGRNTTLDVYIAQSTLQSASIHFLNLNLTPFLPFGRGAQRVEFSWGSDKHASSVLTSDGWVSLPVDRLDWIGQENGMLEVKLSCPDAVSPNRIDRSNADPREISVGFLALSITQHALGQTLRLEKVTSP